MALTKETVIDLMEILEDGQIQVRTATRILEDGVVISQQFHRHAVEPGADFSKEEPRVKAACSAFHTEATVQAYQVKKAAVEIQKGVK